MIPPIKPHLQTKIAPKEPYFKAIIISVFLSVFFAVGNAYLGLKIGTTISASISALFFIGGLVHA